MMKIRLGLYLAVAVLCVMSITRSVSVYAGDFTLPAGFTRESYARGLKQPTAIAFQRNKIFVAQKEGKLRVIKSNGKLRTKAYAKIKVSSDKERGLLGVAIDPNYRQIPFVYVYYTTDEIGRTVIAGVFPDNSNYPVPYRDAFFYGDWSLGWVHALTLDANNHVTAQYEFDEPGGPVAFAIGHDGNIYLASFFRGVIFKYVYTAP